MPGRQTRERAMHRSDRLAPTILTLKCQKPPLGDVARSLALRRSAPAGAHWGHITPRSAQKR
jgi:hypothetical protein